MRGYLKGALKGAPPPVRKTIAKGYHATTPVRSVIGRARDQRAIRAAATAVPGSAAWLIEREARYGGLVRDVPRAKVSPSDPRDAEAIRVGGMTGGDRMSYEHNGYAAAYGSLLAGRAADVVLEVGILRGTGLAIWCDLFAEARVIGFDIDLDNFRANRERLESLGAFAVNKPEVHEYDQFGTPAEDINAVLGGSTLDVVIDDGYHGDTPVRQSLLQLAPFMSADFLYVVEDMPRCLPLVSAAVPEWRWRCVGGLVVGTRG